MNRSMKSVCKVVIILLAAGAVLFGAGLIFGARPADLWSKAELRFPCFVNSNGPAVSISADNGYEALDNDFSADGVYTVPAADVTALDLRWVAGSVTVRYGDVSEITFQESSYRTIDKNLALRYSAEPGGLLRIQYCTAGTITGMPEKNLLIQLPREMEGALTSFRFDGASAALTVDGLRAGEVTLNSSSGDLRYTGDCDVFDADLSSGLLCYVGVADRLTASSSSGDITLRGGVTSGADVSTSSGRVQVEWSVSPADLEVDTSSGAISFAADHVPENLSLSSTSGAVTMALPDNAGFTLDFDTASGEFSGTLPVRVQDGRYLSGDGAAALLVQTSSGDLTLNAK